MSLPISIHRKSYWPVTFAAVAGTAADFIDVSDIDTPADASYHMCSRTGPSIGPERSNEVPHGLRSETTNQHPVERNSFVLIQEI